MPAAANSIPCPTTTKSFIPRGSPAAFVREKPLGEGALGLDTAVVMVRRVPTAAEAKRRIESLRRQLRSCRGAFVRSPESSPSPGGVDAVNAVALGEGGIALASHVTFFGLTKPATSYALMFSTGPFLVHVEGFGPNGAVKANATAAAHAVVEAVKRGG